MTITFASVRRWRARMKLFLSALWFVAVLLLMGVAKLLFENILYAAIMTRLKSTFGLQEGDLIAIVTNNLIEVTATIVAVVLIYWASSRHQASTMADFTPNSPTKKQGILRRLIDLNPLPAIVIGLAFAFGGGLYWELHYGPLTGLRTPPEAIKSAIPQLSSADKAKRLAALTVISNTVVQMRSACALGREIAENWQYKVQTGGADALTGELNRFSALVWLGGGFNPQYTFSAYLVYSDIVPMISTEWQFPSVLSSTTSALVDEINRIKEHKADIIFTLINDVKLADWKKALPECERWTEAKVNDIAAKRVIYTDTTPAK